DEALQQLPVRHSAAILPKGGPAKVADDVTQLAGRHVGRSLAWQRLSPLNTERNRACAPIFSELPLRPFYPTPSPGGASWLLDRQPACRYDWRCAWVEVARSRRTLIRLSKSRGNNFHGHGERRSS